MMSDALLPKGTIVTLLTSYCGDDSEGCTNRQPCGECLEMCNTYEIRESVVADYKGQVCDKSRLK